jgi:hypothetical protein|tara:strand:- start:1785 stop:2066 length:282 start_codon:yes stop_codon:yes gene_type:complete
MERMQVLIHRYNIGGNRDPAFVEMFLGRLIEENGELRIKVRTNQVIEDSVKDRLHAYATDLCHYIMGLGHLTRDQQKLITDQIQTMPVHYYPK